MDTKSLSLYLLYFWGCSIYAVLAPFYPPEAYNKGMSSDSVGYLFSLYALVAFMLSPVSGKIMNKIGRKNVLIIGGITESIGMLIFAFVVDFDETLFITFSVIGRILMGAGGSALLITCFAVISNLYPKDMEAKIGIMETLGGLGLMFGPFFGGVLFSLTNYKFVFIFYTVLFLVLTFLTYIILPNDNPEKNKEDSKVSYSRILKIKQVIVTLIVVIFGMAGPAFLEPVLAQNLKESQGLSSTWIGIYFAFPTLGYTIALKMLMMLPKEVDRRHVLFVGLFIEGISFILIGPWSIIVEPNMVLTAVGLVFLGFGSAWGYIPSLPYLIDCVSGEIQGADREILSNTLSTIMGTTHYLGETLGPIIGGNLCKYSGYEDGYAYFGLIILGYFLIFAVINNEFSAFCRCNFYTKEDKGKLKESLLNNDN